MNWIYRIRPITAMLVFIVMLTGEATAADVTRLSGAELKPDAFADGAYGMVYYQKTNGEWDYFSGYVDAVSEASITLRESPLYRRKISLQRIYSALVGPTRKDVEAEIEDWQRASLAQQLGLPLYSDTSRTYLPTTAAIMEAHREALRAEQPLSNLSDPHYLRGRFDGNLQIEKAARTSLRAGFISGLAGGLLTSLIWIWELYGGDQKRIPLKIAAIGISSLVPPTLASIVPPRPDEPSPPSYALGYRTRFNAQRREITRNAAGGWILGSGFGFASPILLGLILWQGEEWD